MDKKLEIRPKFKLLLFVLIGLGIASFAGGFAVDAKQTWANFLLNNYYFLSLAIGATFFLALQRVTHSGWSSAFIRIPEAIGAYIPIGTILMLLLLVGAHSLYHWSHHEAVLNDEILQHKSPYLNITFFAVRIIIFLFAWTIMTWLMRRASLKEDVEGGLSYFKKNELMSRIYIFILAITFSMATFDWIMSIDAHWFSTIFALKNFISAFYHGSVVITIIAILLHKTGYLPMLTKYHLHDFSKYIFALSIIWGYFWLSQYLLIWFANIPEETVYYVTRLKDEWKTLFFANLIINWFVPFLGLMWNRLAKNSTVLLIMGAILLLGQWIDLYMQIMPGATGIRNIGFIEIGSFLGFLGLFALVISIAMSRASVVPVKHPYIEESLHHKTH